MDGTHRWKASRTWKAVALAAAVRKVLGSSWPCWRELMRSEGGDRRRHWLGHSACLRPTTLHGRSTRPGGGQPPQGGERMDEVRAGVRGANRVTTRGRRNRLRCRWRPRGSSCLKVGALVSVAGQGRNRWSEKREPTAREIWDWTGTRDNKSVAEIGAKHLLTAG